MRLVYIICAYLFSVAYGSTVSASSFSESEEISDSVEYYQERYQVMDLYSKIVNNVGNGFEDLYGTRNVRVVLDGLYYRGGGNNYYHRTNKRKNMNPLPNDGLINLCKDGFGDAIYLYSTRFDTAPKSVSCVTRQGKKNTLNYQSWVYNEVEKNDLVIEMVYNRIKSNDSRPIYSHCWNGWHASGLLAALSLRQFCGMSSDDAVGYWIENADGTADNPNSYQHIKRKIKNYKIKTDMKITKSQKDLFCQSAVENKLLIYR